MLVFQCINGSYHVYFLWKNICEICNSKFSNKDLYESHLFEVHEIKNKDSASSRKEELKNHVKGGYFIKAETLLLECQFCELKTLSKGNLNQHIARVHEGRSPNTCKFCGSSFKSNSLMKIHMKEEHDFHENQCSICKMVFKSSSIMKKHVRSVHEGIKRKNSNKHRVCDICGHISKCLKSHKNHTKNKHFSCTNCKDNFSRQEDLDEHLKKVHGSNEESKNKLMNRNQSCFTRT